MFISLVNRQTATGLLLLFLSLNYLHGQEHVDTNFKTEIEYAFAGLNKNKVPNAMLLDYSMDLTNVERYNGQWSDSSKYICKIIQGVWRIF